MADPVKGNRPVGRPTKYDPEMGDALIEWMGEGYSLTAAAGKIGVSRQTVYAWAEEKPDFSDALNLARAVSASWWEDRARDLALDKDAGSAPVVIFGLKNRVADEWRDKQEINHQSSDGSMTPQPGLDVSGLSDAALAELHKAIKRGGSDPA